MCYTKTEEKGIPPRVIVYGSCTVTMEKEYGVQSRAPVGDCLRKTTDTNRSGLNEGGGGR